MAFSQSHSRISSTISSWGKLTTTTPSHGSKCPCWWRVPAASSTPSYFRNRSQPSNHQLNATPHEFMHDAPNATTNESIATTSYERSWGNPSSTTGKISIILDFFSKLNLIVFDKYLEFNKSNKFIYLPFQNSIMNQNQGPNQLDSTANMLQHNFDVQVS